MLRHRFAPHPTRALCQFHFGDDRLHGPTQADRKYQIRIEIQSEVIISIRLSRIYFRDMVIGHGDYLSKLKNVFPSSEAFNDQFEVGRISINSFLVQSPSTNSIRSKRQTQNS